MKIPKSVKIGGHTYKIVWDEDLWRRDGFRGAACWHTHEISLDTEQHPQWEAYVFLHELVHVIGKHFKNDAFDEDTTTAIAEGLFQVFGDMGITFER